MRKKKGGGGGGGGGGGSTTRCPFPTRMLSHSNVSFIVRKKKSYNSVSINKNAESFQCFIHCKKKKKGGGGGKHNSVSIPTRMLSHSNVSFIVRKKKKKKERKKGTTRCP